MNKWVSGKWETDDWIYAFLVLESHLVVLRSLNSGRFRRLYGIQGVESVS